MKKRLVSGLCSLALMTSLGCNTSSAYRIKLKPNDQIEHEIARGDFDNDGDIERILTTVQIKPATTVDQINDIRFNYYTIVKGKDGIEGGPFVFELGKRPYTEHSGHGLLIYDENKLLKYHLRYDFDQERYIASKVILEEIGTYSQ